MQRLGTVAQLFSAHPRDELPGGVAYDATAAAVIQPIEVVVGVTIRGMGSRTMISWPAHSACSQALAFVLARKIRRANDGKVKYSIGTLLERVLTGVSRLGRIWLLGYEDDAWTGGAEGFGGDAGLYSGLSPGRMAVQ
jgi:hypothetical protein